MISRLRFTNFKAWRDSKSMRLAPLTVLFGTNSAGKTSIPQLLLLLKQTAESPDRQRALHLGDSRASVDAGTYDDAVHAHDTAKPLDVELEWTLDETFVVSDPATGSEYGGNSIRFECSFYGDKRRQPAIGSLQYTLLRDGQGVLGVGMKRRGFANAFDLASTGYSLVRHPGRARPLPPPLRFYGFPDETTAYYQNTAFLSDLVLELERLLRGVYSVGPLREFPRRLYLWSGEVPDHVGAKGDRAVEAILASGSRAFNWFPKQKTKPLAAVVAERLRSMGLIRDFRVKALGPHRNEYEVLAKTSPRMPEVKLTDVGFGVSQVLPVIVECFYVPPRSVVIFEQPEIHLHPKVQAELADLFIDAIHAREDGVERQCQFIVESHSEYFLRRLQRRIAEETLAAEDAALYFVETEQGTARIKELDVDAYGNIRNWPKDFFGDEMDDLVARTEAQARRAARETGGV